MLRRRIGGTDGIEVSALCLGALPLGTYVDEKTSFAILDRFVEAGGTLIDTADNYCFWEPGRTGDESESTLGRWLASRPGLRDQVHLATKAGGRPVKPGGTLEDAEGLSAPVLREALQGSLRRLGTDRVDLFYTHIEDRSVPLEETVGTLDGLVRDGSTRLLGVSNHATWRIERARATATAHGWTPYTCVQQRYSYLQPRSDLPLPEGGHTHATGGLLDHVRSEPDLTLLAYSTLLSGAYTRADKQLPAAYDHPGTPRRLAALREVAAELGATVNQVVLAWLTGGSPSVLPIVGFSSVAQLDETIAAMDLTLDPAHRALLDAAA
ncbi:aldo/keto reductase [Actinacidiphila oryziradicis]|uniref:aldo/keto reductase n=1 Tax=Actinacidiphila oryziradicis TaxID=2571141 RepID=UPI0023EFAAA3|nr:aldo/keto reductase [Actinacidiphila oryziradicis]MCW2870405.1 putative reductase [Actinacidiphila oryziradicis]